MLMTGTEAGEERNEVARNNFAAPVGRRYVVDHFEAAAIAEAASDPAGRAESSTSGSDWVISAS